MEGRAGRKKDTCDDADGENARARHSRGAIPTRGVDGNDEIVPVLGDETRIEARMALRHEEGAIGCVFGRRCPPLGPQRWKRGCGNVRWEPNEHMERDFSAHVYKLHLSA